MKITGTPKPAEEQPIIQVLMLVFQCSLKPHGNCKKLFLECYWMMMLI